MFAYKFFKFFSGRLLAILLISFSLAVGAYFLHKQINLADAQTTFDICLSNTCQITPTQEVTIDAHCLSYIVKNNGTRGVFVPTKTATEFQNFIFYHPTDIQLIDPYGGDVICPTVVFNSITYNSIYKNGLCWLDRNLGASQVCTSSTDANCYGDLYQWGRGADGHQIRNSGTTATLSTTDIPGHANFITTSASPYDWRSPQNNNLWEGASGINNPCPSGFRLPTEAELTTEMNSWCENNSTGAFGSRLKLPLAGYRDNTGGLASVGSYGYLWSSAVSTTYARLLNFIPSSAYLSSNFRVYGGSVRCVIDMISLNYSAGPGGAISGAANQVIVSGNSGTAVTAVPKDGYVFVKWSDGSTQNPRTDLNVTADKTVTAEFDCGTYVLDSLVYGTVRKDGKCWLDRNLGASQVCTSSTDANCYGDLYQWGRLTDGHQIRTSGTTATLSTTDIPGHANFITTSASPYDWRSPQNNNLWEGASGINNPCPSGFRLPTEAELNTERLSWSSNNSAGAFASSLKIPMAGFRHNNGSFGSVGSRCTLWSSTVSSNNARFLSSYSHTANFDSHPRSYSFSVRCLRD